MDVPGNSPPTKMVALQLNSINQSTRMSHHLVFSLHVLKPGGTFTLCAFNVFTEDAVERVWYFVICVLEIYFLYFSMLDQLCFVWRCVHNRDQGDYLNSVFEIVCPRQFFVFPLIVVFSLLFFHCCV